MPSDRYRQIFPKRHTLLLVIHVEDVSQAARNALVAYENGADGVFLINHRIPAETMVRYYRAIRGCVPDLWVGMNFLDLSPVDALRTLPDEGVGGIWTDDAGYDESLGQISLGGATFGLRRAIHPARPLHFGGVAFKYRTPVADPARAAAAMAPHVDVVTTSGPGTGMAADIAKIRAMKEAIGDAPLAIASGITPENVVDYLPWTDCFLVATGVSASETELDPLRVLALADVIANANG